MRRSESHRRRSPGKAKPDKLQWIVAKALRKDREERYQNVKEMLGDLRDLKADLTMLRLEGRATQGSAMRRRPKRSVGAQREYRAGRRTKLMKSGRTISSAEIINEIRRHKRGAWIALAASMAAVAATIVFL